MWGDWSGPPLQNQQPQSRHKQEGRKETLSGPFQGAGRSVDGMTVMVRIGCVEK